MRRQVETAALQPLILITAEYDDSRPPVCPSQMSSIRPGASDESQRKPAGRLPAEATGSYAEVTVQGSGHQSQAVPRLEGTQGKRAGQSPVSRLLGGNQ